MLLYVSGSAQQSFRVRCLETYNGVLLLNTVRIAAIVV